MTLNQMMQTNTARTAAITERLLEGMNLYKISRILKIEMNFLEIFTCCTGYLYEAPVHRLLVQHVLVVNTLLDSIICLH